LIIKVLTQHSKDTSYRFLPIKIDRLLNKV
jgi:hypothetical protein